MTTITVTLPEQKLVMFPLSNEAEIQLESGFLTVWDFALRKVSKPHTGLVAVFVPGSWLTATSDITAAPRLEAVA